MVLKASKCETIVKEQAAYWHNFSFSHPSEIKSSCLPFFFRRSLLIRKFHFRCPKCVLFFRNSFVKVFYYLSRELFIIIFINRS